MRAAPRRTGRARQALAAGLAALGLAALVGGCGDPSPLGDVLSESQQTALARSLGTLDLPPEPGAGAPKIEAFSREHADAIDAACDGLDRANRLLAAYDDSCRLAADLLRSASQTGPCLMDYAARCRTAHERMAENDRRAAAAAAALGRAAAVIEDRACREEVAGTADQQQALQELPAIAARMAKTHADRQRDAFDEASGDYSDALARVSGGAEADGRQMVREYVAACDPPKAAGLDRLTARQPAP